LRSLDGSEASFSKGLESTKGLFKARDGHFLESVLISQRDRQTVCLSTQMGCKMACSFCASGKAKFLRNLTAGEIVEQVAWIQRKIEKRVSNIVFMGMGEPLDNFDATMKAIEILIADWGFQLGGRRITVSTSGITPKIIEFVERVDGRVRLSVSLHSSKPDVRNELKLSTPSAMDLRTALLDAIKAATMGNSGGRSAAAPSGCVPEGPGAKFVNGVPTTDDDAARRGVPARLRGHGRPSPRDR
jgi:adenine C2-methylase RlmN of 23S rRNA A2503 and tRNA A37